MTDIKELIECSDLATRQVLWFYELCKSGVVSCFSDSTCSVFKVRGNSYIICN